MDQIAGNQHVPGFEPTDDARNIFIAFKGHVHAVDEHIGNAVQGRYDNDIALCSLFHQVKNPGDGFFAVEAPSADFNYFQFFYSFSTQSRAKNSMVICLTEISGVFLNPELLYCLVTKLPKTQYKKIPGTCQVA
jgi:hypothetical protein